MVKNRSWDRYKKIITDFLDWDAGPLSLFWTHRFGNCSIVRLGLSGGRLSVLEEYPEPVAPA